MSDVRNTDPWHLEIDLNHEDTKLSLCLRVLVVGLAQGVAFAAGLAARVAAGLAARVAVGYAAGLAAGLATGDAAGAGFSTFVACDATTCHLPSRRA